MIIKAALLLFRGADVQKELLFTRAHHRPYYVFPGGKQEQGESIKEALRRELQEELKVKAKSIQKLGVAEGATPDGRPLQMHLYSAVLVGKPEPSTEIEEIAWMTRDVALQNHDLMTPMSLEHVFPLKEWKLW